jgi:hypothetical protein
MSDQKLIENYGYVPFQYFQYAILLFQVWMIYNHTQVNDFMDRFFDPNDNNKQNIKKFILTIPFLSMVYYDVRYSSFSFKNLGIPPMYNDTIKQILNILGSYALIHIFAQDSGFKTAITQAKFVQLHILFIVASVGMAYSVTQNRSQSILALIMFYHIKYVISNDIVE